MGRQQREAQAADTKVRIRLEARCQKCRELVTAEVQGADDQGAALERTRNAPVDLDLAGKRRRPGLIEKQILGAKQADAVQMVLGDETDLGLATDVGIEADPQSVPCRALQEVCARRQSRRAVVFGPPEGEDGLAFG